MARKSTNSNSLLGTSCKYGINASLKFLFLLFDSPTSTMICQNINENNSIKHEIDHNQMILEYSESIKH
uniref:Uncharacterized protein n=1 Tax=Arundo donax TaxID=35708 RepID=A0A0A8YY37_ARUDO